MLATPHFPPPADALAGASLFLDLDGTLLELATRPDEVRADAELRELLAALAETVPLAIVSGRSLAQLAAILGPIDPRIALAGSHGAEARWPGHAPEILRPAALDRIAERMRDFAAGRAGLLVEDKTLGVGLHYRAAPAWAEDAEALAAELARDHDLILQRGHMMAEVRAAGDKGRAIAALMARPEMAGTTPIMLGDDVTDEDAFEVAVRLGGYGILIGEPRASAARYRLADPAAVRAWLAAQVRITA
jgi:trehalose 6-phosphate phosphatase